MDGLVGSKGGGGASIASLLDMDITKEREGERSLEEIAEK